MFQSIWKTLSTLTLSNLFKANCNLYWLMWKSSKLKRLFLGSKKHPLDNKIHHRNHPTNERIQWIFSVYHRENVCLSASVPVSVYILPFQSLEKQCLNARCVFKVWMAACVRASAFVYVCTVDVTHNDTIELQNGSKPDTALQSATKKKSLYCKRTSTSYECVLAFHRYAL